MQVSEIAIDPATILGPADLQHERTRDRVHLSAIYRDLEDQFVKRDNTLSEEELNAYRSMGFMWEWMVEKALAEGLQDWACFRPGEVELDGIVGSPDLVDFNCDTVVDTKATWRSSRKLDALEKHFWPWLVQLKGYCKMLRFRKGRVLVFCVNGDYKPPRPRIRCFNLEWTQREIDENWLMVVGHARRRGWIK